MENIKEIDIIYTVIAGTIAMFVLAAVLVLGVIKYQKKVLSQKETLRLAEKKFQRELLDATIAATEKERQEVGTNLHDEVGTYLNLINNNQGRLKRNINNTELLLELITSNTEFVNKIYAVVRSVSGGLKNDNVIKLGIARALNDLKNEINDQKIAQLNIFPEDVPRNRYSERAELQLYRVCKESINNILKHSGSTEININLNFTPELISIAIKYNGTGINDADVKRIMENNKGVGLKSLYSRMQVLDGKINYTTEANQPAAILIEVPVKIEA